MTKIPSQLPPFPSHPSAQQAAARAGEGASFQGALDQASIGRVPDGRPLDARTLALLARLIQRHLTQAGMAALSGGSAGTGAAFGGGGMGGLLSHATTQGALQARLGSSLPNGANRGLRPAPQTGEGVRGSVSAEAGPSTSEGPPTEAPAAERPAGGTSGQEADPEEEAPYSGLIGEAAERHGLPKELVRAVVRVESDFQSDAVSSAGAQGLMQLMPETAKDLGVEDPFDPRQNIMGGARYLKQLLGRYDGDRDMALAAYNWGMGNLERHPERMPDETVRYIKKVNSQLA